MATSIIDKELINQIKSLDEKQKQALLALIKSFKSQRVTIEEYNKELDEANERIENGEFITAEQLKKEAQTW